MSDRSGNLKHHEALAAGSGLYVCSMDPPLLGIRLASCTVCYQVVVRCMQTSG